MTDDAAFLAAFEDGTLQMFAHRDHLRLAWLLLRRHPLDRALGELERGIRRYAAQRGASDKYHHTVTIVWLRLVAAAVAEAPEEGFDALLRRRPDLLDRDAPRCYYSPGVLDSAPARAGWIEPDLRPLPHIVQEG